MFCEICNKEIPEKRVQQGKTTCCKSCAIKKTKREHLSDPVYAAQYSAKLSRARSAYLSTPEGLAQHKNIVTTSWKKPEVKEKHREAQKQFWSSLTDEEYESQKNAISTGMRLWHDTLDESGLQKLSDKNRKITLKRWSKTSKEGRYLIGRKISKALSITNKTEETHQRRSSSSKRACKLRRDSGYYETEEWKEISRRQKEREHETKKRNGTFNTSKPAKDSKQKLRDLGFTVEEEKPYPNEGNLHCDAYIKELDLWIEFHYCHYHNYKPFDKTNEEHLKEVKRFQHLYEVTPKDAKNRNQYSSILFSWTDLDVRKRNNAQKHQLNYLCFYSPEDFDKWLNSKKHNSNGRS